MSASFTWAQEIVLGDFEEVYGVDGNEEQGSEPQSGKWNAVLTCFFLDTVNDILPYSHMASEDFASFFQAKNVVNYLRIIRKILAPGGIWINLGNTSSIISESLITLEQTGPLLWHWENNTTNDPSIELDLVEVKELCQKLGFRLAVSIPFSVECFLSPC